MKKWINLFAVLCFTAAGAQTISDYTYAYIPNEFKDFKDNKYGLTKVLATELQKKGYKIQKGDLMSQEVDGCQMVYPEVLNTSTFLRNKVKIEFRDCNKNLISSYDGMSLEKDYEAGFLEAIQKAMQKLMVSNPSTTPVVRKAQAQTQATAPKTQEAPVEKIVKGNDIPEQKEVTYTEPAKANQAEIFTNKNLNFNKINLSDRQFILANPNSSTPFATFRESTKRGVFRVQLADGNSTLGYYEEGNLVVELPTADGNFRKEVFNRK